MSISFSIEFRSSEIAWQCRLNRVLAWLPRLGVVGPARRRFVRTMLRAGEIAADFKLRRVGLQVGTLTATWGGRETPIRTIRGSGPVSGIVLDIHGRAWAFGSAKADDRPNADFALAGAIVLAVDYALALPPPIEALQAECADVLEWLLTAAPAEFSRLPIVVAGESAGAHLALSAVIAVRKRGLSLDRVRGLLLHCGAYDLGGAPSALAAGRECLVLHGPTLAAQMALLTDGRDAVARRAPPLSPLYDDLAGLPPVVMMVGDIDPLRDDSLLLKQAIRGVGGIADTAILPHAPHAVIHMPGRYADRVRAAAARWVKAALTRSSPGRT